MISSVWVSEDVNVQKTVIRELVWFPDDNTPCFLVQV